MPAAGTTDLYDGGGDCKCFTFDIASDKLELIRQVLNSPRPNDSVVLSGHSPRRNNLKTQY
jgi:hypothetical protein